MPELRGYSDFSRRLFDNSGKLNLSIRKGEIRLQSRYVLVTAATLLTIAGTTTSASAKTKSTGVKINTVKSSAKTVTGKATPGAKVTVTRYKVTYATGKANKTGVFKLKLNHAVTANWHYRVTATKKGYKTTVKHFGVKVAPVKVTPSVTVPGISTTSNVNVDELKAQIANLQAQLTSANNTSIAQINALNNKLGNLQNQLNQTQNSLNKVKSDLGITDKPEHHNITEAQYEAAKSKMDELQKELHHKKRLLFVWQSSPDSAKELVDDYKRQIKEIQTELSMDPNNQKLQYELQQGTHANEDAETECKDA